MCEPQNCEQLLFYSCPARRAKKTTHQLSSRQRHRQASHQRTQLVNYLTQETPLKSEYYNSDTGSSARFMSHGKWIRPGSLEYVQRRSQVHIILRQCHTTDTKPGKLNWRQWESFHCEGEHRGTFHILICAQCVSSRTTEWTVDTCGNRPLDLWR